MDEDIKLPEPVAWIAEYGGDIYTADQLRAAVEADREQRVPIPASIAPVPRYKIGYRTDEWGERSSTPGGIPDPEGAWVRYDDHAAAIARAAHASAAQEDALDAARYRWLRKGANDEVAVVRGLGAMDYGMSAVVSTYSEEIDGDDLDAAIDAAMKEDSHG